jgi:hypothetical protein
MGEMNLDSAARRQRRGRLERFASNDRVFPGGDHPTGNCGACARIVTDRFGGKVVGYYHADNPTARVGETEFGHDFAITEDRFLVDPWLFHYYGDAPVLDLTEPVGQAEAAARYGPEENKKPIIRSITVEPSCNEAVSAIRGEETHETGNA